MFNHLPAAIIKVSKLPRNITYNIGRGHLRHAREDKVNIWTFEMKCVINKAEEGVLMRSVCPCNFQGQMFM